MKKNEPTKVKVTEKDFNFLKKVNGLRDDILIKRTKVQDKEISTVLVADEYWSYMVQTTQFNPVLTGEKFGLKNTKAFLKAVATYGEMEEKENEIVFSLGKKKTTYKKLDESTIQPVKLPEIDTAGYVSISLSQTEIKEIVEGLKNDLSDYASLSITTDNKLKMKIGEMTYDNLFELEIKDINRKETGEIKFLTKLAYLTRLFTTLDEGSKVNLFLKAGSPLICKEASETTHTKTFIAPAADENDEEKVDAIINENEGESET